MAAADLNADGRSELIINNIVISENESGTPKIRNTLSAAEGSNCTTFAASLDQDHPKDIQLIMGDGVYNSTGKLLFQLANSGYNAVADIRKDIPGLEIIQSGGGHLAIYNGLTGAPIFQKNLMEFTELTCPDGNVGGGPPTVGDFRGDGTSQIAVATGRSLTIFDSLGNMIAGSLTKDCSSRSTGITSFDFNGDGQPEIIYGDENYLRIYHMDKSTNLNPIYEILNPSGTLLEYPVVADVNGDHISELVVVSNNYAALRLYDDPAVGEKANGITGLRVFKSQVDRSWMPTRSIWNQYAYFVNNVFDNLSATSSTLASNSDLNLYFRRNTQGENSSLRCIE